MFLFLEGSKKISSEEETYSDQSVLIYYHNVAGMYHVYSPYSPLVQASNSSLAKVRVSTSCLYQCSLPQMDCQRTGMHIMHAPESLRDWQAFKRSSHAAICCLTSLLSICASGGFCPQPSVQSLQAAAAAFTRINATLLPFVAMSPQGQTFTPYSQLTNKQRANITAAAYNLAEQVMAAAVALNASKVWLCLMHLMHSAYF